MWRIKMSVLVVYFLMIWAVCAALHLWAEYLDYEAPAKQEARYKNRIKNKYGLEYSIDPKQLIGTKSMNKKLLDEKAVAYAKNMLQQLPSQNVQHKEIETRLFNYFKEYYIDRHNLEL